jgi:hypothetical protein
MIRRRQLLALPLVALGTSLVGATLIAAAPAAAAEHGDKAPPPPPFLDLLPVGMPIVVDGELVNYVFVNVRLNLAPGADMVRCRAKEPYFRDALVRAGHAQPFVVPGDNDKIDAARLSAVLMRAAPGIAGPGVVRSVVVTKQVPMRLARSPRA